MVNEKPPLAEAAIEGFPVRYARFGDADLSPDGSQGLGLILLNPRGWQRPDEPRGG